jgi:hypothetical protein
LIETPSLKISPVACVFLARSEPARSTKFNLLVTILFPTAHNYHDFTCMLSSLTPEAMLSRCCTILTHSCSLALSNCIFSSSRATFSFNWARNLASSARGTLLTTEDVSLFGLVVLFVQCCQLKQHTITITAHNNPTPEHINHRLRLNTQQHAKKQKNLQHDSKRPTPHHS